VVIGFSLGGNQVLKLAGELGDQAAGLIAGVCAVSTPIDLAACVRALGRRENFLYEWRFVSRMTERMRLRNRLMPDIFRIDGLHGVRTVYDFDDRITAPFFGFGTADNYYATQSAQNFLSRIRIPTLLVAAHDDTMVPFDVYSHQAIASNPAIELIGVPHGGHLGFISAKPPRFWLDGVVLDWALQRVRCVKRSRGRIETDVPSG
jgi:predicted alpha/beta-fold hydrolase